MFRYKYVPNPISRKGKILPKKNAPPRISAHLPLMEGVLGAGASPRREQ
jgi:hypothetical protein